MSEFFNALGDFVISLAPVTVAFALTGFLLPYIVRVVAFLTGTPLPTAEKAKNDDKLKNDDLVAFEWNDEVLHVVDAPESEPPR